MCSSKHLDRTRSGPDSEQICRVNSILDRTTEEGRLFQTGIVLGKKEYFRASL